MQQQSGRRCTPPSSAAKPAHKGRSGTIKVLIAMLAVLVLGCVAAAVALSFSNSGGGDSTTSIRTEVVLSGRWRNASYASFATPCVPSSRACRLLPRCCSLSSSHHPSLPAQYGLSRVADSHLFCVRALPDAVLQTSQPACVMQ